MALYSTGLMMDSVNILMDCPLPKLTDQMKHSLLEPVSFEEIKNSLWGMKPYKAPGPDGLHPVFFQRFWNMTSESLVKFVRDFFCKKRFPMGANDTLISLIPKCKGPENMGQFRPISLCNVPYKMISKILVNRIRPLLSQFHRPFSVQLHRWQESGR